MENPLEDFSGFKLVTSRKKGKRKHRTNLVIDTNLEDTRSVASGQYGTAYELQNVSEDESLHEPKKEGLTSDGFWYATGETNSIIGEEGNNHPSPTTSIKPEHELLETEANSQENENEESIQISETPFNEKALPRFAATYELEKFQKNALIIFNQEDIDDKPRYGTQTDVDALTNTFEKFGFEVKENTHHDLTKSEIIDKVKEFTKRDYTDYGSIGVALLTHGSHYGRLRAKDKTYSEIEIINLLKVKNKPTLVTKPRFLIIQACRGTHAKTPVPVLRQGTIRTDTDEDLEPYHLPEEADMLILHSCYVGSPALRHEVDGSWFIQSLCKTIDQLAHERDLESIITEVKRVVAIDRFKAERDKLPVQMSQMPVLTSTLIRKLYLRKFGDPPPLDTGPGISGAVIWPPTRKDSQALDMATTPLLPQFGPCSCFLDHFNYLRECLKHFVEENPDDTTARLHLDLANDYEDKVEHNTHKQKMLRIIQDYLRTNAKDYKYYKYLYLTNF